MNHFAVHLKLTQHCKSAILQKKKKAKKKKKNELEKRKPVYWAVTWGSIAENREGLRSPLPSPVVSQRQEVLKRHAARWTRGLA